jgi:hypothetical protein
MRSTSSWSRDSSQAPVYTPTSTATTAAAAASRTSSSRSTRNPRACARPAPSTQLSRTSASSTSGDAVSTLPFARFVVHCRKSPYDVYIGRANPSVAGGSRPEWGNPFKITARTDRLTVIAQYEQWLLAQPDLVAKAKRELKGKVLACWCAPLACHGDVLARVANEEDADPVDQTDQ